MKNPPCQSAWRVQKLSGTLLSSLAVFYVEQVALNRHVSPQLRLHRLSLKTRLKSTVALNGPDKSRDNKIHLSCVQLEGKQSRMRRANPNERGLPVKTRPSDQ